MTGATTFQARVLQTGKTTTGIPVPAGIVESLGAGKRPPVRVTVNGYTYRTTIGVMGGTFLLSVSAEVRDAAAVAGGDTVSVQLALDDAPREVTVPDELRKALARDAGARRAFEALSRSAKQRYTLPIEKAKAPETRMRNAEKAVAALRAS
jgi:hypothetical protein